VKTTVRGALLFSMGRLPMGIVSATAANSASELLKGMLMSKLRYVFVLALIIGAVGGGAGVAALREANALPNPEKETELPKVAAPKKERENNRGLDEPLPSGAVARLGTLRFRHGERINDIALGADGKSVISAAGKIVYIWELETGKLRLKLDNFDAVVHCVASSPAGKLFAVGCEDGTIRLMNPADGREARRFTAHQVRVRDWVGPTGVSSMQFCPDGQKLVSTGSDLSIRLWNTAYGEQLSLVWQFQSVCGLAWSPEGKTLASATQLNDHWAVQLWEDAMRKEQTPLTELGGRPTTIAFSNDGKMLAVGVGKDVWN
jgi:hypothetical protein